MSAPLKFLSVPTWWCKVFYIVCHYNQWFLLRLYIRSAIKKMPNLTSRSVLNSLSRICLALVFWKRRWSRSFLSDGGDGEDVNACVRIGGVQIPHKRYCPGHLCGDLEGKRHALPAEALIEGEQGSVHPGLDQVARVVLSAEQGSPSWPSSHPASYEEKKKKPWDPHRPPSASPCRCSTRGHLWGPPLPPCSCEGWHEWSWLGILTCGDLSRRPGQSWEVWGTWSRTWGWSCGTSPPASTGPSSPSWWGGPASSRPRGTPWTWSDTDSGPEREASRCQSTRGSCHHTQGWSWTSFGQFSINNPAVKYICTHSKQQPIFSKSFIKYVFKDEKLNLAEVDYWKHQASESKAFALIPQLNM